MNTPYGNNLKLFITGGSHDEKIAMRLENFPAGLRVDTAALCAFLQRRAPGQGELATARREVDEPVFLAGISDGVTDGSPIEAVIYNRDQHPADYAFRDTPRPSHADYTAVMKYGKEVDLRGGGHFSGRLTAPYCIAGSLCLQLLAQKGIAVFGHIYAISGVRDTPFAMAEVGERERALLAGRTFPVLDEKQGHEMQLRITAAKIEGDSAGGIIETAVTGLPVGLGEHLFASAEARISSAVFAIPGVKGIEFGSGFAGTVRRGSENNDPFATDGKTVYTLTNNAGGILGGMTSGMPLVFRAALKPTPSIARPQQTVSLSKMENTTLLITGRHDPCIVPRAVPVLEAAAALAVADMLLDEGCESHADR